MADRIHANSEWLDKCARDLASIEDAIAGACSALAATKLRKDEGGDLKVSLTCRLSMTGTSFNGSNASDDIRQLQRAAASLATATSAFSGGATKAARLFEQAENKAVQQIRSAATGTQSGAYGNNAATGVKGTGKANTDPAKTRKEYDEMCAQRRKNAYDKDVASLYDKYRKKIVIGDDSYSGTAHYDPDTKKISLNWKKDAKNKRGPGCTYFHESGHLIDDYLVDKGDASSSKAFSQALKSDFDNYVNKVMKENKCSKDRAYEIISDWLRTDGAKKNGVSDLCGGLSQGKCEGNWGHDPEYWANRGKEHGIPSELNNEAFAHFFEASMYTDSTKVNYIKEIFPNAYNEFKKIVRNNL